jgi:hypothetical protein
MKFTSIIGETGVLLMLRNPKKKKSKFIGIQKSEYKDSKVF